MPEGLKLFRFADSASVTVHWVVARSLYEATKLFTQETGHGDYVTVREVTLESMVGELADLKDGESFVVGSVDFKLEAA